MLSAIVLKGDSRSGVNPVLEPALRSLENSNSLAKGEATMCRPVGGTVSGTDPIPTRVTALVFHFCYSAGRFDLV